MGLSLKHDVTQAVILVTNLTECSASVYYVSDLQQSSSSWIDLCFGCLPNRKFAKRKYPFKASSPESESWIRDSEMLLSLFSLSQILCKHAFYCTCFKMKERHLVSRYQARHHKLSHSRPPTGLQVGRESLQPPPTVLLCETCWRKRSGAPPHPVLPGEDGN